MSTSTAHPGNVVGVSALHPVRKYARWLYGVLLCMAASGCGAVSGQDAEESYSVATTLTGIDHLPGHLAVQSFAVDGEGGGRAGKGGRITCCMRLPGKWRPDMVVRINWGVTNFRDCKADEYVAHVPVERYEKVGALYVHFFADGSVRVVSSNDGPAGALHPESVYPIKTPIPQKDPWHQYPLEQTCRGKDRSVAPTQHKEGDVDYVD